MAVLLSLFFHGPLLRPEVMQRMRLDQVTVPIPNEQEVVAAIRSWVGSLDANSALGEAALEQRFNSSILVSALGYQLYPQPTGATATAWAKPPASATHLAGTPDVVLGEFSASGEAFLAVVELKTPGTNLDAPQTRVPPLTPVQQAFEYAGSLSGVQWVIVSDMKLIRLYGVGDATSYQLFDLSEVAKGGDALADFHTLLSYPSLIVGGHDSYVARLVETSLDRQQDLRAGFYDAYSNIRQDVYSAIASAPQLAGASPAPGHDELLSATQRLLDRLLFIFYCEDHPEHLLPKSTLRNAINAASYLPGTSATRIYEVVKSLFREIDVGSASGSGRSIPAYNGELFKPDRIVDSVSLPDSLATKPYSAKIGGHTTRLIRGIYGLDVFNYWTELDEHLLGHIFEESLSEIARGRTLTPAFAGVLTPAPDKVEQRKAHGVFFTSQLITDFLVQAAVADLIAERATPPAGTDDQGLRMTLERQIEAVHSIRAIDLSCGSGAFLVSAYAAIMRVWRQAQDSLNALEGKNPDLGLFAGQPTQLVRASLFGSDLLPQAVEISKLALWLRSARAGEKVSDLHENLVACDSLDVPALLAKLRVDPDDMASFDLVVGNPPWGGQVDSASRAAVCRQTGLDPAVDWDSWELFVALSLAFLREGGRLALVLPDTLFHPEKQATRALLNRSLELERVLYLGPDWFGPRIRMGTVLLQGRRGRRTKSSRYVGMLLAGKARREALRGRLRLSQAEKTLSLSIPQARIDRSPSLEFSVAVSDVDDALLDGITRCSVPLHSLCARARGEEINREAVVWRCPGCLRETVPGRKRKEGGYLGKICPHCGFTLNETSVTKRSMLTLVAAGLGLVPGTAPWLDGDQVVGRYRQLTPTHVLNTSVAGWTYKPPSLYRGPKILIRQAGVGLSATIDPTDAYVPQSIYLYRLRASSAAAGYSLNYVLGALLSRTMHYVVVKRFQEVDPARAHAKMTHARLEGLPIPAVDFSDPVSKGLHDEVARAVGRLLTSTQPNGSPDDMAVETSLRRLYGITPLAGAYINGELGKLPEGAELRELFPTGVAKPVRLNDAGLQITQPSD